MALTNKQILSFFNFSVIFSTGLIVITTMLTGSIIPLIVFFIIFSIVIPYLFIFKVEAKNE
jgi:hypothetical protein